MAFGFPLASEHSLTTLSDPDRVRPVLKLYHGLHDSAGLTGDAREAIQPPGCAPMRACCRIGPSASVKSFRKRFRRRGQFGLWGSRRLRLFPGTNLGGTRAGKAPAPVPLARAPGVSGAPLRAAPRFRNAS